MIYAIEEKIKEIPMQDANKYKLAAIVMTERQISDYCRKKGIHWEEYCERKVQFCKAESREEYLTGGMNIPMKKDRKEHYFFSYLIWEGGILFADNSGCVDTVIQEMIQGKTWKSPSIGKFFCGFLETLTSEELPFLEKMENKLGKLEEQILRGTVKDFNWKMIALRKKIMEQFHYYSQLGDMVHVLQENTNKIFTEEESRSFKLFLDRLGRIREETEMLREYSIQVREFYQTQIDIRQNTVMKILTVVTAIFLPLTLIVGWYGMNFVHMPELQWKYGYPGVIGLSIAVIICCLIIFKRKKFW